MKTDQPTIIENLATRISVPDGGILTVPLQHSEHVKVILFGFAEGQELSEHTASVPALMHQISGKATWKIGDQTIHAEPHTWSSMPAGMPHSVTAITPCIMLLTLLFGAAAKS